MSAVANIVINDAQATPVAHTFIPLGPDSLGAWWYEDQTGLSPLGYSRISLQLVRAPIGRSGENSGQRVSRIKIGIHTPKLETLGTNDAGLTPPTQVAYVPRCNIEYIISDRGNLQDRKDLRAYSSGVLGNAQVVAMIETLQNVF